MSTNSRNDIVGPEVSHPTRKDWQIPDFFSCQRFLTANKHHRFLILEVFSTGNVFVPYFVYKQFEVRYFDEFESTSL